MIAFLLNRWVILVISIFLMMVAFNPDWLMRAVRMFGKMGWAESSVGSGGTFTIWRIIGILAPIAAIIYFFSGGVKLNQQSKVQDNVDVQTQQQDYQGYQGN